MTFITPGNFPRDGYGFAPPTFGGAVAVKYGTVAITDTSAKVLFTLPKGAVIIDAFVNVLTAFNAGDSNVLDLGIGATANALANDLALGTPGHITAGLVYSAMLTTPLTATTNITATYVPAGTAANAGAAVVAVYYILR